MRNRAEQGYFASSAKLVISSCLTWSQGKAPMESVTFQKFLVYYTNNESQRMVPGAESSHTTLGKILGEVQRWLLPFQLQKVTLMFLFCLFSHKTPTAFSWSAGKDLNLIVWSGRNSKWEKMAWYLAHQYKWERVISSSWLGSKVLKQNLAILETSGECMTTLFKWYSPSRD